MAQLVINRLGIAIHRTAAEQARFDEGRRKIVDDAIEATRDDFRKIKKKYKAKGRKPLRR